MPQKMTRDAASRIQSASSRQNGGQTPAGSFASRAQRAAYRNEPRSSSDNSSNESSQSNLCCLLGLFSIAAGAAAYYYATSVNNDSPTLSIFKNL